MATTVTAKKVILKNDEGEYLIPYTDNGGGFTPALFQPFISLTKLNHPSLVNSADYSWLNSGYKSAYDALVERYNAGEDATETVGGITISYKWNSQYAMKIIAPEQIENAESIFNVTGSQPYYILDTANARFKLPRFKTIPQFTNDTNSVGNYNEPGLPNAKGSFVPSSPNNNEACKFGASSKASTSGALYMGNFSNTACSRETDNNYYGGVLKLDLSRSNPLFKDGVNTVQPPTTNWLLYYYLGESQIDETSITGEVLENINNKVDLDCANISDTGKKLISELGMPSDKYIDLTLGASGTTYTAPAAGWLMLSKNANQNGGDATPRYVEISNTTKEYYFQNNGSYDFVLTVLIEASKGDTLTVTYSAAGKVNEFRFIYAEGAK